MTEHCFAASVEPIPEIEPAPGPRPTLAACGRAVGRFIRGVCGLDAYERYVEHETRMHGKEHQVMSRAEFWRAEWSDSGEHPKPRCC